jgi:hypothetical protein
MIICGDRLQDGCAHAFAFARRRHRSPPRRSAGQSDDFSSYNQQISRSTPIQSHYSTTCSNLGERNCPKHDRNFYVAVSPSLLSDVELVGSAPLDASWAWSHMHGVIAIDSFPLGVYPSILRWSLPVEMIASFVRLLIVLNMNVMFSTRLLSQVCNSLVAVNVFYICPRAPCANFSHPAIQDGSLARMQRLSGVEGRSQKLTRGLLLVPLLPTRPDFLPGFPALRVLRTLLHLPANL